MPTIMQYFLLVLCCFVSKSVCISYTNVIELPQGKIRGVQTLNGDHRKFLGIPYATLVERFQEPGDPPTWDGIFDTINGAISCNQYIPRLGLPTGQEDCLVLSVHTPAQSEARRIYPVMVFVHGGGYYWGSGTSLIYDPDPLIKKGVIVVIVNYRLGAFGFLCLRIKDAPGNVGLKDQVAALQWVKNNIKYFGGDPQSVTIFGQSAGSASVNYLMLSSLTKGLFRRAILQSGTALSPFAFSTDPIDRAAIFATRLGYNTKNPYELLNIFRNASATEIIMASVPDDTINPLASYIFRPCIERPSIDSKAFMTKSPKEILESGNYYKVPTIIGYNDKEGITYVGRYNKKTLNTLYNNFEKALPDNLYFRNIMERKTVSEDIKSFYFKNSINITDGFIDYFSDMLFHYPSVAVSEYILENSRLPVFNYYFKYDSYRNLGKFLSGLKNQKGAAHTDELFYLFQPIVLWPLPRMENDVTVIDRMTTIWTDFAKTGNPSLSLSTNWISSGSGNLKFIILDKETRSSSLPNWRRIEFWKNIYNKYGN